MPDGFFADLPPMEDDSLPGEVPQSEDILPESRPCGGCGEAIFRPAGSKGRWPKFHPECRPSAGRSGRSASSVTGSPRVVRVSKSEQEAAEQTELILARLEAALTKAAMLLSLVNAYDALVIRVNTPEIVNNSRSLLLSSEKLRGWCKAADTGGSAFGLILALITTFLPIAANHNWIPSKKVANFVLNIPVVMMRMQKRIEEGGDGNLTDVLFAQAAREAQVKREAEQKRRTAEESPPHAAPE